MFYNFFREQFITITSFCTASIFLSSGYWRNQVWHISERLRYRSRSWHIFTTNFAQATLFLSSWSWCNSFLFSFCFARVLIFGIYNHENVSTTLQIFCEDYGRGEVVRQGQSPPWYNTFEHCVEDFSGFSGKYSSFLGNSQIFPKIWRSFFFKRIQHFER